MKITQNATSLGRHEEALGGMSAKKSYASPTVKVVEFLVERGFETSDPSAGTVFQVETRDQVRQDRDNDYRWRTADNGWF